MFTHLLTYIYVLILHFPFFLHSSCFYRFHTHVIKYKTKQNLSINMDNAPPTVTTIPPSYLHYQHNRCRTIPIAYIITFPIFFPIPMNLPSCQHLVPINIPYLRSTFVSGQHQHSHQYMISTSSSVASNTTAACLQTGQILAYSQYAD